MEYLTSADCAKKWNVSQRRVAIYCKEGRIEGAIMMGRMWMIPKEAKKPEDPRKAKKNIQQCNSDREKVRYWLNQRL